MKKIVRRIALFIILCFSALIVFTVGEVFLFKYVNPPVTFSMIRGWYNQKTQNRYYRAPRYQWCNLEDISPNLRKAVLAGEDQRFLNHKGFDFIEFKEVVKDIIETRRIRGASTISMQTARSLFLWTDRTVFRKIVEAYYTVLMEFLWDKERILEVYLNIVDWGGGVMGAEAAANKYFNTHAGLLTADQAACLAAILPSPYRWSPVELNDYAYMRKIKILNDMKYMPLIGNIKDRSPVIEAGIASSVFT
ncbi:MAG: monofunctional biosynthetic peptidoglycan transglycosylase [Syntrophales bacterium]|nr:monofunctional biosynthetic peptidoglycan transglycosylase [Syntrophales bacterium]MDY0043851.1 monofunctional biosynthetic peptidoglycan transglycosylase [Syntrophales bacterium]